MHKIFSKHFCKPQGLLGHYLSNKINKVNEIVYHQLDNYVDFSDGENVFEIGFGTGYGLFYFLDKYNIHYHGIDYSKQMYRRTVNLKKKHFPSNEGVLHYGDFLDFENDGVIFNAVVFSNVTYFWKDLEPPFIKIFNMLQDNGRLVFYMSDGSRLEKMEHSNTSYFNRHKKDDVKQVLENCGFKDVDSFPFSEEQQDRIVFRAYKG